MNLQQEFEKLNTEKFENKLAGYIVKRRSMHCFGNVCFKDKIIKINRHTKSNKSKLNILLHECVHAYLHETKKVYGHTTEFWRLFKEEGGQITPVNKLLFKRAHTVAYERNVKVTREWMQKQKNCKGLNEREQDVFLAEPVEKVKA